MTPKQIEEYYTRIAKQGKAEFKLVFKSAPSDDNFINNDPVADVTVVATDPVTGSEIHRQTTQMSANVAEREVTITVLSVPGILKKVWDRFKGQDQLKPYEVTVEVKPHLGWEHQYDPQSFPLSVRTGSNPPIHIWMPAKPGRHRGLKLDKP